MAILVTCGAGYIGSATVDRVRAKDEEVVFLDDPRRGHRPTRWRPSACSNLWHAEQRTTRLKRIQLTAVSVWRT
jgi:UDP-glucose 4-epimerase